MRQFFTLSLWLTTVILLVTACQAESEFERSERALRDDPKFDYTIETAKGPVTVKVRLALDFKTRQRGLMYLRTMPAREGMLFIYPGEGERSFWMRNTYIPLDLIFIRRSGTISHITHSVPPLKDTSYPSNGKVLAVLELNGGEAKKLGIAVGDTAKIPLKWRLKADW